MRERSTIGEKRERIESKGINVSMWYVVWEGAGCDVGDSVCACDVSSRPPPPAAPKTGK